MRLLIAGMFLLCAALRAQLLVNPSKAAIAEGYFSDRTHDHPLRCEVSPLHPQLNYGFRFQAGYIVRVPMNQFSGPGHMWATMTKVTPEGTQQPVYLGTSMKLPVVPKNKSVVDFGGFFLLGEGRYTVDWVLFDDMDRVCRKSWHVEAKLNGAERGLKIGMDPQTVAPVSFRRWTGQAADVHPLRRLTVWLHAAPIYARSIKLRAQDRVTLLGSLASLLETLPAQSVKLVVFNLDQQKELFRREDLSPDQFSQVAQSMNNVELGLVDIHVLQNKRGHIDLLADLLNEELSSDKPSDAVVLLGPATRYLDKLSKLALDTPQGKGPPQFFYFQFKPYLARAELSDSLVSAIGKVKGKTSVIRTAADFAKAIKQVQAQVAAVE